MEKLLEGVDVEWKLLGEVCNFQNGFAFKSNLFKQQGYPIIRIGNIENNNVNLSDVKYFDHKDYKIGNPLDYSISKGDVLIAMSGATTGKIGYYNFDNPAYLNQRVGKFIPHEEKLNNRYLFHFLGSKTNFLFELAGGGAQPNLGTKAIKNKIKIPIPPLEVQQKIVDILDTFTELTAELKTELASELAAREKQYEYYREQLLSFGNSLVIGGQQLFDSKGKVVWKTLEEITISTSNINWNENNKTYQYISLSSVCLENNSIIETSEITANNAPSRAKRLVLKNDVIFATTRPTQQRLYLINDKYSGQVASTGYCILRAKSNIVLPKWIFFYLTSFKFNDYVEKNQSGSAYPAISDSKIKKFKIPVPPLEEQRRIVSILDKFDTLTRSISEGLPREIELREKQYEYYRGKLLSF